MSRHSLNALLMMLGLFAMMVAVACDFVTVATFGPPSANPHPYNGILRDSLYWLAIADCCFVAVVCIGRTPWRIAALIACLPSLFVLEQFRERFQ
ncbi:MAG TPA: hypothetical protein VH370_04905 [Humisphaera sp.]|jgi:hypothetical protein|nr:hypothetical protein [Humisphaera sp.]